MEILEKIREDLTTVVNPDQIANIDIGLEGAEEVSGKQDEVSSSGSTTFRAIPVESVSNPPSLSDESSTGFNTPIITLDKLICLIISSSQNLFFFQKEES